MLGLVVDGQKFLIANIDGKFYAMRSVCNHMGGPLEKGILEGSVVTCPLHGSKWEVTTGKLVRFVRQLPPEPTYEIEVVGDRLFIEI